MVELRFDLDLDLPVQLLLAILRRLYDQETFPLHPYLSAEIPVEAFAHRIGWQ